MENQSYESEVLAREALNECLNLGPNVTIISLFALLFSVKMTHNWESYNLSQLRASATTTFRQGGGSRPDVLLIEIDGKKAVLKDQNGADTLFSFLIGPLLNWRECKALKKLATSPYSPDLLSIPDSRSFLMSYHESEQATRLKSISPDWPQFFQKLQIAVDNLHEHGVAHNDLRNPTNILITPEGEPVLVDLVACFCLGSGWNKPNQWLFNKFTQVDKSAISKLKRKVAPELINADDIEPENIAGRPGLIAKKMGQLIRRLSRFLFTK